MSSSHKISYSLIIVAIVIIMLSWFLFAPSFNAKTSNAEEATTEFDIVIDPNVVPNCSINNPLCRDQIEALSNLEDFIKTKNTLIKYPIFSTSLFEDEKKEIETIKKQADRQYFENYFFDSSQQYDEAKTKLLDLLNQIKATKSKLETDLDLLFFDKRYEQMPALIELLEDYSVNDFKIKDYELKMNSGPRFDDNYSEALDSFRLEKYRESLGFVNKALVLFPENNDAKNLKKKIKENILEIDTKNAISSIKNMLFNSDLDLEDLELVSEKVDELEKLNRSYDVEEFKKDIKERKISLIYTGHINDAAEAFKNERFEKTIASLNQARDLKGLDNDSKFKLKISNDILVLISDLKEILGGNYDLKKQSSLDLLKNKISESKKIYSYSSNLLKITENAERIYSQQNKFIKIRLFSDESFFVDIGTLKLGNFSEKVIELRPGKYDFLIKRRGMPTSRLSLDVASSSSTQSLIIKCSESKCSINRNI